jgi:3-(3-hydroxy-phenyl)propionate hydroxylase
MNSSQFDDQDFFACDYDVVIVGCGPTGAALANALGAQGIRVCVVERNIGVCPFPRAIHIDGETMRVLQSLDLAAASLAIMRPGGAMQWVNADGATLLTRTSVEGLGSQGFHNDYYFHQPEFETVLREGLSRYASVYLAEGWEVQALTQDIEGVDLSLTPAKGAQTDDFVRTLRARYVIGCDGARSTVRALTSGNDFEDFGEHQAWLVVDGVLNRPLDLPEYSVQHCDPSRPATSIYVHPLRRRWELMLLPSEDPELMTEPQTVWRLLHRWVKPGQATLERAATYVFHSLVARRWQEGRVLLAGDSVHQTPPFLGQGLCAGMRDVANLSWKLIHELRDRPSAGKLLATYGPERIPHVRAFIALAVKVGHWIQQTDTQQAKERDTRLLRHDHSFAFPSPRLGDGIHRAHSNAMAVGRIAPQFEGPDGRWSDDVAGAAWSLWLDANISGQIDEALLFRLKDAGVAVLFDPGLRAREWLAENGAGAALLRPDRYVFDICENRAALETALKDMQRWMRV